MPARVRVQNRAVNFSFEQVNVLQHRTGGTILPYFVSPESVVESLSIVKNATWVLTARFFFATLIPI
jgi:hypothetical protein